MSSITLPVESQRSLNGPSANRRASVRWRAAPATPGKVFVAATYETIYGGVLDLSVNGVGLLLSRPLELDTLVLIALEGTKGAGTFELLSQVARVTPQRDGTWVVGCSFYTDLTEDELESLL
jgi:hypothetical protein